MQRYFPMSGITSAVKRFFSRSPAPTTMSPGSPSHLHVSPYDRPLYLIASICSSTSLQCVPTSSPEAKSSYVSNGDKITGLWPITNTLLKTFHQEHLLIQEQEVAEELNTWVNSIIRPALEAKDFKVVAESAKSLDKELSTKTFMVGHALSAADLVVYGYMHQHISKLNRVQRFEVPNLCRHFDLIQHLVPSTKEFPLIEIDLDVPRDLVVVEKKEKAKSAVDGATAKSAAADGKGKVDAKTAEGAKESKKEKKEKKEAKKEEKKEKKPAAQTAAPAAPSPAGLDLRVGYVTKVERHPQADALYVEEIDLGTETRTVVSGLVKFMPEEGLLNKHVVLLCNLKPAKMRGIESQAMVLAATSVDGQTVELVQPPSASKPGDRVYIEGYENGEPETPKKVAKTWEAVQPGLKTVQGGVAIWVDGEGKEKKMVTKDGVCGCKTIVGGGIR